MGEDGVGSVSGSEIGGEACIMDNKWRHVECGCCHGLQWGGEEPRECLDCMGNGLTWIRPGGHTFLYPGGPATGMRTVKDYEKGVPVNV